MKPNKTVKCNVKIPQNSNKVKRNLKYKLLQQEIIIKV